MGGIYFTYILRILSLGLNIQHEADYPIEILSERTRLDRHPVPSLISNFYLDPKEDLFEHDFHPR